MSKLFQSFALFAVLFCATQSSFAQSTFPSLSIACTHLTTPVQVSVTYSTRSGGIFTGSMTSFYYTTTGTNYIPVFTSPVNTYRLESLTFNFNSNSYSVSRATLDLYGSYHWVSSIPGNTLHINDLGGGNYSFSQY